MHSRLGLGLFEYWETAEEAVAHSRRAYCPHCRGAGWIIRQLRRVHGRDAQPLLARLFGPAPVLPQLPPSSQTPVDITQGAEARRASIFSGEPDTAAIDQVRRDGAWLRPYITEAEPPAATRWARAP